MVATASTTTMPAENLIRKPKLVWVVALLLSCLVIVVLASKLRTLAYAKTQPYEVSISVQGEVNNHVFFAYDYGHGIVDQNVRRLDLDQQSQTFNFSVSAWKQVHAVYVFAPQDRPFKISSLILLRNNATHQVSVPSAGPVLEGVNWFYRFPLSEFEI